MEKLFAYALLKDFNQDAVNYFLDSQMVASLTDHHPFEITCHCLSWCFPGGSDGKASAYNAGDLGSIPGLGRSLGEGHGNPLQYSCLENPMDRGAW